MISDVGHLFMYLPVGHLYVFFGKTFIQLLCPLSFLFFYFLINLFIHLFIFGCVGSPLLRGLLFVAVRSLLIAVASLVAEHGL